MRQVKDPGLGKSYQRKVSRFINPDGSFNIVRIGGMHGVRDLYKFFIDIHWSLFFLSLAGLYLFMNTVFASIYLWIGIEYISGVNPEYSNFTNALLFSFQTFTTVGYGGLHPAGFLTGMIASFEAFTGLLSFAVATGLLYGRFSKPASFIRFSNNVIITPFEEGNAMMFKMVNLRNTTLLNTKVKVTLIIDESKDQTAYNKNYFNIDLEVDFVNFFPLTWTLVHKINEDSPLFNLSIQELKQRNAEIVLLIESFDETHSQTVLTKHSYAEDQWLDGVKFARNFEPNAEGKIELNINKIDELIEL